MHVFWGVGQETNMLCFFLHRFLLLLCHACLRLGEGWLKLLGVENIVPHVPTEFEAFIDASDASNITCITDLRRARSDARGLGWRSASGLEGRDGQGQLQVPWHH